MIMITVSYYNGLKHGKRLKGCGAESGSGTLEGR
jgi:hypothetical protein